jgi:hypothetical protein
MRWLCLVTAVVLALTGCVRKFTVQITVDGQPAPVFNDAAWRALAESLPREARGPEGALPLEAVLWQVGAAPVESLSVGDQSFAWREVYADAWLRRDGRVQVGAEVLPASMLAVARPADAPRALDLYALAPTVSGALGVRSPKQTVGRALAGYEAEHVCVIVIEGLGRTRFEQVRNQGTVPFLDSLGLPRLMRSVYPGVPAVTQAALLTGAPLQRNGVRSVADAKLEAEPLSQVLAEAQRRAVLVQGAAPSYDPSGAEMRRANGEDIDAAISALALGVIADDMPALLWVRFPGLAEAGRNSGLGSASEMATLTALDALVQELVIALPAGTLTVVCGDYGLHPISEQDPRGQGGSLLGDDLLVPLWVVQS